MTESPVRPGCDRLLARAHVLRGRPYGLLGHGASVTSGGHPLHRALAVSAAGAPSALFGPEHGYYGVEQDMVASDHGIDPWTGAPIISLYGTEEGSLRPSPSAFDGLEVLVVDLQDIGSRYYTYVATALWAAEVALALGLEVWFLDRPNPLGGERVEGNLVRPGFESFVGAFSIPVRHGMTLGELARLEARRRGWPDGWTVIEMTGWQRHMTFAETGLPWVAPSPNMPTPTTALIYPGGCLIEGTEISEGRGTTRPFELCGAPGVDPLRLADLLEERRIPGAAFLPTYFKPQFQKHGGQVCGGVQVRVTEIASFPSFLCGVELVWASSQTLGESFAWRRDPYEFEIHRPAIDLLAGGDELRVSVDTRDRQALDEWIAGWPKAVRDFGFEREAALLYP